MKYTTWKNNQEIMAGTVLRNPDMPEYGNLALHVGGDLEKVIENRLVLSNDLGISLNEWVLPQQTHSDHLVEVTSADKGKGAFTYESGIADCDALYTRESGILLGVMHADCVPVLLYDEANGIIAAIHSGWQGTVKEITSKVVRELIEKEGCDPKHLLAYIGASIAFNSFEVGEDVISKVKAMSFDTTPFIAYKENGKALVDNKGLNKQMLLDLGVSPENISIDKNDTFTANESFFSFRRDQNCGRHLSFITKK
ncbi:MAG: peptidoglycan editing factor PgeF [Erysipelotrichaceae bacterium]